MRYFFYSRLRTGSVLFLCLCVCGLSTSASVDASAVYLAGFPLLKQQHSLTCESSAASMATRGILPESRIMAAMPRNPNPNLGFRGNPDGQEGKKLLDYGVYAAPIQKALARFGYQSDLISYGTDAQVKSYLNRGWPVVVWMTYALKPSAPRLVDAGGIQFFLVPWEHAVLVVGYDDHTLTANDPWTGQAVRYQWAAFNRSWGLFGNMGLAVQSCIPPQPVSEVRVHAPTTGGVSWTWPISARAARYRLTLTNGGSRRKLLYTGTQALNSFAYAAPRPGRGYVFSVTSVSQCGAVSSGTSVWYFAPPAPTPTPTATSSATPVEATVTPITATITPTTPTITPTTATPSGTAPTSTAIAPTPSATPPR